MPPVFEQVTFFYEILLRFGDQSTNRGQLIGAHLQTLTQTLMDGKIIATNDNGPQQLALVSDESGQKLSDILGEVNANTIVENQVLGAANQSLSDQITLTINANQQLGTELDQVREQLTNAQAEVKRLNDLLNQSAAVAEPLQEEAPPAE